MIGEISPALFWALTGIFLLILEIVTPGFVAIFFGLGALVAALTTYLGLTPTFPAGLLVFSLASVVLLFSLRRFFRKTFQGKEKQADILLNFEVEEGKIVSVTEDIHPARPGRVRYQGTEWPATADQTILKGSQVRLLKRDNLTLVVEPVENETQTKER